MAHPYKRLRSIYHLTHTPYIPPHTYTHCPSQDANYLRALLSLRTALTNPDLMDSTVDRDADSERDGDGRYPAPSI